MRRKAHEPPATDRKPTTRAEWRAIEEVDPAELEDLKARIVRKVDERELGMPTAFLLESIKPISRIGSEALIIAEPLVDAVLGLRDYYTFRKMLENRDNLEDLIQRLEAAEEERRAVADARKLARRARQARARRAAQAVRIARRTRGNRGESGGARKPP